MGVCLTTLTSNLITHCQFTKSADPTNSEKIGRKRRSSIDWTSPDVRIFSAAFELRRDFVSPNTLVIAEEFASGKTVNRRSRPSRQSNKGRQPCRYRNWKANRRRWATWTHSPFDMPPCLAMTFARAAEVYDRILGNQSKRLRTLAHRSWNLGMGRQPHEESFAQCRSAVRNRPLSRSWPKVQD